MEVLPNLYMLSFVESIFKFAFVCVCVCVQLDRAPRCLCCMSKTAEWTTVSKWEEKTHT